MSPTERPCIPVEDLAQLDLLPPDDERVRHVDGCPRCRARYQSYRSFMEPEPLPQGADPEAARRRIGAWLEHEVFQPSAPAREPVMSVRPRRMRWLWALAPVLGVAAAVLILTMRSQDGATDSARRWRGARPGPSITLDLQLKPGPEGLLLSWTRAPSATGYEVVALAADDQVVERLSTGAASSWTLASEDLERLVREGALRLRVVAWSGERELARSPALEIPTPGD